MQTFRTLFVFFYKQKASKKFYIHGVFYDEAAVLTFFFLFLFLLFVVTVTLARRVGATWEQMSSQRSRLVSRACEVSTSAVQGHGRSRHLFGARSRVSLTGESARE
jgi:hypothetical protein